LSLLAALISVDRRRDSDDGTALLVSTVISAGLASRYVLDRPHCWLGIRKSIRPVKIEWWGIGVVICLERGANDLHVVELIA